ncbi:MAG TPA: LysM domain-containing protein [Microthrixaceae bacterium]|nr:LysM domain-containing protein [Microthrixaceae bacterium]
MAAIIDIYTGSRISPLTEQPQTVRSDSERPNKNSLRVIPGGLSPEGVRMRRIFFFRRCLAGLVLLALVIGLALAGRAVFGSTGSTGSSTVGALEGAGSYVVHAGDTLWGVALELSPDRDPRDVIDDIARVNSASGATFDPNRPLTPGQKLLLPSAG